MVIDSLSRFRQERNRRCIPPCSVDEIPDCQCLEEYIYYQFFTIFGMPHSAAMSEVVKKYGSQRP